jgi:hypothetical protein
MVLASMAGAAENMLMDGEHVLRVEENAEARAIQQLLCCATRRHAFIVRARGVTAAKGRGT